MEKYRVVQTDEFSPEASDHFESHAVFSVQRKSWWWWTEKECFTTYKKALAYLDELTSSKSETKSKVLLERKCV